MRFSKRYRNCLAIILLLVFGWPHLHQDVHRLTHHRCPPSNDACEADQNSAENCLICAYDFYLATVMDSAIYCFSDPFMMPLYARSSGDIALQMWKWYHLRAPPESTELINLL